MLMTDAQKWLILAGLLVTGWLLYLLAPVLTPFLVAATLAYLGDPIADRLEKLKLSRTLAVIIVFAVMISAGLILLLVLLPVLQEQLLTLFRRIPQLINWIQLELLPKLSSNLGIDVNSVNLDAVRDVFKENWRDLGNIAGLVLGKVTASGQWFLIWLTYLLLIPVVTFYMLRDWDGLVENMTALIPRQYESTVVKLASECDRVLSQFLRGQLLVMLVLGVIYALGLWITGIEFALLIGLGAGLVSFVPYLGAIVGVGVAGTVAFVQFHDALHLIYVAIVFGVGQTIEGMVLSPWLVGERIGLHPVAVIFAVLAGGQLFGFFGVLLALPVAAVVTVLLRFIHEQYKDSNFYTP